MKAIIYISGKIGTDTTLLDVIRQVKSYEFYDSVEAHINSAGGDVNEGKAIYNYLKNLDKETPVTTIAIKAYSISALIFAAGSIRIAFDKENILFLHFPWTQNVGGNADDLEEVALEMRKIEADFIKFYTDFLNIDKETVRNLLDDETFLSGKEAIALNFATELKKETAANAELKIKTKIKTKMEKEEKGFLAYMAAYFDKKIPVNAELKLVDAVDVEIIFPELEEGDTPKEGDSATVDGAAIPDGSHIMPSLEEATVVFKDGKIESIEEKKEEVEINAEQIKEVCTYSVETTNTSFEEGETLMFEGWEDEEPYTARAGEYYIPSQKKSIVTDASGVIVLVKDSEGAVKPEGDPLQVEASLKKLIEKEVKTSINASLELEKELKKRDLEINALKKEIKSSELKHNNEEDKRKKGKSLAESWG